MLKINFFIQLATMALFSTSVIAKEAENVGMPQMSFPDFMPQLVWLCIIFPIIYLTMKYIALPRISEIITNRELKISSDLTKAEEIKKKIEQINNEHQAAIEKTNHEIKEIVSKINIKMHTEAEKKLKDCQSEINNKIEKEKNKLEKEIDDFNLNLNNISSEIVENIISKFYDDKPDSSIIKSKVDKYIESYKNE